MTAVKGKSRSSDIFVSNPTFPLAFRSGKRAGYPGWVTESQKPPMSEPQRDYSIPRLRSLAFLFVLLLPASCLADKVQPKQAAPQAKTEAGLRALAAGDLNTAAQQFREELAANPKAVPALLGLAEIARRWRQPAQTEKHLRAALEAAPDNAEVHRAWARYLMGESRLPEAEAALRKSIRLLPAYAAQKDLGDLYLHRRQIPQAIEAYRAAVKLSPNSAEGHHAYATALAAAGQKTTAESEFRRAARLNPNDPAPLYSLGLFHTEAKRLDEAIGVFSEILNAHPRFGAAYVARGDVYALLGQDAKALADYASALKVEPRIATAQMKSGMLHLRNQRVPEAELAFREAIRLDPKMADAYNNLAFLAAEKKANLDTALDWAKKAVELAPESPRFLDTLGWVHRARGELDIAASVLEKGSRLKPAHADIFYHLGIVYAEKGRNADAVRSFERALALAPGSPEAVDARRRLESLR
jgi:tetratricopeptide (TPR) repeat protein